MGLTGPGQGEECKGWLQGAANGHLQLTSFPCPEQPHTVPTPACPQPGVGTGTLLLCQSVMRFLLGCLDRKSQLEDAKSLSKAQQSPAQSIQRYPVGSISTGSIQEHPLHSLAWGTLGTCSPEASLPVYPTAPCSSPCLALVQPPHAQAGGARYTLGHPSLHASTVPTLLSSWLPVSASQCCRMPVLCGEVLAPCSCVCRTCVCRVAPRCASGHLIFPPSSSKSTSSKSGECLCRCWGLQGRGCAQWALLHTPKESFPPPAPRAVNLLLQMANFENPLIRIRSSTSIFIYFSFS